MNGDSFDSLLQTITWRSPPDSVNFVEACRRARRAGGRPFEVLVGAPNTAHGVRMTFESGVDSAALNAAFELQDHPWGLPTWIGLRWSATGGLQAKPYHRLPPVKSIDLPPVPAGAPVGLKPVMAARWKDRIELYARWRQAGPWSAFVAPCAALIDAPPPAVTPRPRPAELGFWVSFGWRGGDLVAVTVGADSRCWGNDDAVSESWSGGLATPDLEAYQRHLAAVRALGPRPNGGWHGMLAWKLSPSGTEQRVVSLRLPAPA
ncbi:MAG: hypothetical protein AAF481_12365 [Acidobacteriota bacterium]